MHTKTVKCHILKDNPHIHIWYRGGPNGMWRRLAVPVCPTRWQLKVVWHFWH